MSNFPITDFYTDLQQFLSEQDSTERMNARMELLRSVMTAVRKLEMGDNPDVDGNYPYFKG